MLNTYNSLAIEEISEHPKLAYPDSNKLLSLEDPASLLMLDFNENRPLVIDDQLNVDQAIFVMKSAHVSLKMVVNSNDELLGLITLKDLLGKKALAAAHEMGISRTDVKVKDIMQTLNKLASLNYNRIKTAKIGDILKNFADIGSEFILLTQHSKQGVCEICGVISATEAAQRLNLPINHALRARSFSEIVTAVNHHFD
ncbi:MAG: CBS domain-containing protein [Pseudohongiellaceae bacterium]|jgi:CBS domain-containing protein